MCWGLSDHRRNTNSFVMEVELCCVWSTGFKRKLDWKLKLLSVYVFPLIYLEKTGCSFAISWNYKVCFWSLPSFLYQSLLPAMDVNLLNCWITMIYFLIYFEFVKISVSFTFCHHHKIGKLLSFSTLHALDTLSQCPFWLCCFNDCVIEKPFGLSDKNLKKQFC